MIDSRGLQPFAETWLPRLDEEMRDVLRGDNPLVARHYRMMQYQMGWVDERLEPGDFPGGKQIRPLLCLMACQAVGGDPNLALPAAAAIEILHNFSLVHDDIEDGDETRRHRPTLWKLWGVPLGINAGDGMFALAYAALLRSSDRGIPPRCMVAAFRRFTRTCVALTEGQHLDLSFERRQRVTVEEYLEMIRGKTASLIAASLSIGALIGDAGDTVDDALYRFGHDIGMAFQIQDDILGIWGVPDVTGKAAGNDILRRKKSLPLLYALEHPTLGARLQALWALEMGSGELDRVMDVLQQAEAREFAEEQLRHYHRRGVAALEEALGAEASQSPLMTLAGDLLMRQA